MKQVVKLTGGTIISGANGGLRVHGGVIRADDRAAVAAILLHGHPNGFTWDDVQALRDACDAYEPTEWTAKERASLAAIRLVAAKVVRLLPPTEEP
jgi:hypothetical protein